MAQDRRLEWVILTSPLVLFLLLFLGFPIVVNLIYSLSAIDFQTLSRPTLTGLGNYRDVLGDPAFWQASWFSLRFALVTALLQCTAGLALAIFLDPILRQHNWLLAILMAPMMVAPALVGLMYRLLLHEFVGPVPHYLWLWFNDSPAFLSGGNAFWTVVTVETLQWTPFALLLFTVAYRGISAEVREAADLDGASAWTKLTRIELPLMAPTIVIAFLIRFIDGFRVFDNIYVLVGSGPGGSTASLSIYIYETFFKQAAIGKAVAASVLLFLAFLVVLVALNNVARRRELQRQ
ncbi:MAG: sugar ABC transporter permease [Pseudomonadota bacterium]